MMSPKTAGRLVGAALLMAYLVYLTGGALVEAATGTPTELSRVAEHQLQIGVGALLMLANSVFVVAIGVLVFPAIVRHDALAARTYVAARVIEAVLLGVGVLSLLTLIPLARASDQATTDAAAGAAEALGQVIPEVNQTAIQIGMIALGIGSLLFCRALARAQIVPRLVAVWGGLGYLILAVGEAGGILGYSGMLHYAVGGVFEVFLGIWLLVTGFPDGAPRSPSGGPFRGETIARRGRPGPRRSPRILQ